MLGDFFPTPSENRGDCYHLHSLAALARYLSVMKAGFSQGQKNCNWENINSS